MRYAQQYFNGIKRSMTRLMPRPSPAAPGYDQLSLLRALSSGPGVSDSTDDAQLAVAFFRTHLAKAGFFTPAEAKRAAAHYRRDKVHWRCQLFAETRSICRDGLPVYALRAGRLDAGLDWSSLPTGPHGDRLYRLRPHRFGFLPRLALASYLGMPSVQALHVTLAGWLEWAGTDKGAQDAYFSNLVVVYRVLALSWAAPFLAAMAEEGNETAANVCLQLFHILAADCAQLSPLIGGSAPNNHRLADQFAAWFLAVCYPELVPSAGSPETLEAAWLAELRRQFQEDGTNFEQSFHYHELGCEMALAYLVISLRRGAAPAGPALTRIAAMLRFQAAPAGRRGRGFALGDTTDDPLLPLDDGGSSARGAWRILYRALCDPAFPPTAATAAGAERAYWLLESLNGVSCSLLPDLSQPLGPLAAFPDGGYFCFRDEVSDDYLLFRSGPAPGSAVFPGHAMSDLLSVYWNTGGRAVLEPAGTYSYAAGGSSADGGPAAPRSYFRSPSAHNGPVLSGHDPLGAPRGRFRNYDSGARAVTRLLDLENVLLWTEGRLEERGALNGWQRGVLRVPGHFVLIYDRVPDLPDNADLACHWQFAPEAALSLSSPRQVAATLEGASFYLCASESIAGIDVAEGRQAPAAGWVSRRYGELEPAPQVICRLQRGSRAAAFAIGAAGNRPLPEVEVLAVSEEGTVIGLRQGEATAICVLGGTKVLLQERGLDIDFDGEVLWLSFTKGRCGEMRTLGMRRVASESLALSLTGTKGTRDCAGWHCTVAEATSDRLSGLWVPTKR